MNSENISKIKNKLKKYLNDKKILDIILFGSIMRGKSLPRDIDIAVITNEKINIDISGFHISLIKPEDFFINPPPIISILLKEGYSLNKNKPLSEFYQFTSRALFKYELRGLKSSMKVKIVNILKGKKGQKGLVEENNGRWLVNQLFIVPIEKDYIFEKFFLNFKIKFNKYYILMH